MAFSHLGRSIFLLSSIVLLATQAPGQAPPAADKAVLDLSPNKQAHFDGKRVLVLLTDGHAGKKEFHAQVWDAVTGKAVQPPFQHEAFVNFAAFSPDGKRVVTASYDKKARVWDALTGKPITPPLTHKKKVQDTAFSPDGKRVATAGFFDGARVWDAATGQPVTSPLVSDGLMNRVAFSPDGKRLLTAGRSISFWDASTGELLHVRSDQRGDLVHAVFHPSLDLILTISTDGKAWIADNRQANPVYAPLAHQMGSAGGVGAAALSADGRRAVTIGHKLAQVWDLKTGKVLSTAKKPDIK
jgi:WD40 repeat protein